MKMSVVQVKKSELQSQKLVVPPWEVPVLQAVHGSDFVTEVGTESQERDAPDATEEYKRLERRYGTDRENGGLSFVAQVYGQHGAGVSKLKREIDAARETKKASAAA